jgi:predicted Zn-dependent protease
MKIFNIIFPLLALNACAKAQDDCGYSKNEYNERISWKNSTPVTIYVHESVPVEFRNDVVEAAATWNYRRELILISPNLATGPNAHSRDSKNVIYYYTTFKSNIEQANTIFMWRGDKVAEADITINARDFKYYSGASGSVNRYSMRALLIHEMGHVLGLDHNDDEVKSVMFPHLGDNNNRFELSESVKKSIDCEY